jgi:hypothetical protein
MLRSKELLLDKAGEAAGGAAGSLLTTPTGGSGSPPSEGKSDSGAGANSTGAPAAAASPGNAPKGTNVQDWKLALPPELQEDASLRTINDVSTLAKSYVHAQKLIGADKIPVPSKHATEEDWKKVYSKLGLPEKLEDYQVELKESATLDKNFIENFKKVAHSAGILPKQAQALADWYQEINANAEQEALKILESRRIEEVEGLKKEWGAAFEKNVTAARKALVKFADADMIAYLDKTGLGNDVRLVKLLAKVGDTLKEDTVVGGDAGAPGVMTPAQAKEEINKIMKNPSHPYFIADHPNHKAAVQEMARLFDMSTRK